MREAKQVDSSPVWFTPSIDGNRKDPEPFRVLLRAITARDKARLDQAMMLQALKSDDEFIERELQKESIRLVSRYVDLVENYSGLDASGIRITPTTGQELVDYILGCQPSEMAVLDEIYGAIMDQSKLAAGVLGNSNGRSCSSSQTTNKAAEQKRGSAAAQTVATAAIPKTTLSFVDSSEKPEGARAT